MSDSTKLLLIAAVTVYGLSLVFIGIATAYRAAKIRGIEREIARLHDEIDSLRSDSERDQPESKKPLRSMFGSH